MTFSRITTRIILLCVFMCAAFSLSWPAEADTITAYCKHACCCGQWADGYTCTGKKAAWGIAAADPHVYPLGTKLKVEGFDTVFTVEDTGSKVKGNHLDIFFPDEIGGHHAALAFGVQTRKVTVLRPGVGKTYAKNQ